MEEMIGEIKDRETRPKHYSEQERFIKIINIM